MKRLILLLLLIPVAVFYGNAVRHTWQYFAAKVAHHRQTIAEESHEYKTIDVNGNATAVAQLPEPVNKHDFRDGPELRQLPSQEKYYFVHENGTRAIAKTFERARPFSEGLAAVSDVEWTEACKEDDRTHLSFGSKPWHYIDTTGKPIAGPFARVSEFHAGRAIVTTLDREWNPICIDKTGKVVFNESRFTEIYPFSKDGHAIVSMGWPPKPNGLIDKNGKLLVSNVPLANFSEGCGAFRDRKTGRFGYMNKNGRIIIQPQYFSAGAFHDGLAAVAYKDEAPTVYEYSTCAKLVYGYIDKSGTFLEIKGANPASVINYASDFQGGKATIAYRPKFKPH